MRRYKNKAIFARIMSRGAWIVRAQVESTFRVQYKLWVRARGIEQRRPASCSTWIFGGPRRPPIPSEFVVPFSVWILVDAFAANDVGVHRSLVLPLSVDLLSFHVIKPIHSFTTLDLRADTSGTLLVMLT